MCLCFFLFQLYCYFLVFSPLLLVVYMSFYFVLYLICILLVIFPFFCCLMSPVVGWYLLVCLVLEVRLTFCLSMIHSVCVLLYLSKVVFLVYLVLHHFLDCWYDSEQLVYISVFEFFEFKLSPDLFK